MSPPTNVPRRTTADLILRGHLWKYRVSTLEQLGRAYFGHTKRPTERARTIVRSLVRDGLLAHTRLFVRPVVLLQRPTFVWAPGVDAPNANSLAYELEKRCATPAIQQTLYFATSAAARRLGGRGGRLKRTHQLSHDLACTNVYLHFELTQPQLAASWLNEDLYAHRLKPGQKLGDALLVGPSGPYRLVEVLGRYTAKHIQSLHDFAVKEQLPYELW